MLILLLNITLGVHKMFALEGKQISVEETETSMQFAKLWGGLLT